MPQRSTSSGSYRYGFNGKENDNEVKGAGNQQDYGMRIYDPRLGRFLSVDPMTKEYPWLSTYQFAANSPISGIDLDGAEYRYFMIQLYQNNGKVKQVVPTAYKVEYEKEFTIETLFGPKKVKIPRIDETFVASVGFYNYKFASYSDMFNAIRILRDPEFEKLSKECHCLPGVDLAYTLEAEEQIGKFSQGLGNSAAAGVLLGDGAKNIKSIIDKFPNLTRLGRTTKESVHKKLNDYVLNKEHPGDGATKAKWFESALGFTKENMGDLVKQILFDESKAVKTVATEFGQKYNQTISIKGANGKSIDVVFGFIKNEDNVVRMTTAIPTKK
jgi:RHS repeat-associated protein